MKTTEKKQHSLGLGGLGKAQSLIKDLQSNSSKQLLDVDIDLIDFDEDQYRQDRESYDLEGLIDNILLNGKITNRVHVQLKKDGRYLMNNGEMRTRSYRILRERLPDDTRWHSIPGYVEPVPILAGFDERASRDIYQMSTNIQQDSGSLFDIADRLSKLEQQYGTEALKGIMSEQMSLKTGKHDLSKWRAIAKVPEKVRAVMQKHDVTDKETINTLSRLHEKSEQEFEQIVDKYAAGELEASLKKVAADAWSKHAKPRQSATKPQPMTTKLQAMSLSVENKKLMVVGKNGQQFEISLPKGYSVTVKGNG
jgi:hypothetical protein